MYNRKHLILSSALSAMLVGGLAFAGDPHNSGRDDTGPDRVQTGTTSGDGMLGNRDDSAMKNMTRDDSEAKVTAILESIKQSPEKAGEKLFILENSMGNQWEIALSKLAQSKANDPSVKELARMIEADHQASQSKLMNIAQQMNLDVPTSIPAGKQKKLDAISALPADKFEACYLLMLKADHAKDITSFADHQAVLEDASVKAYIAEVLPKLREHGQHVLQVAQTKNIGSSDFAVGGADQNMMGNTDQSTRREGTQRGPSPDTNRKPTDTQPPR